MSSQSTVVSPLGTSTPNARGRPTGPLPTPSKSRGKGQTNGSILTFFKKAEPKAAYDNELFVGDGVKDKLRFYDEEDTSGQLGAGYDKDELYGAPSPPGLRFNESDASVKRRKLSDSKENVKDKAEHVDSTEGKGGDPAGCSPPPPDINDERNKVPPNTINGATPEERLRIQRKGPFFQDSDSEEEDEQAVVERQDPEQEDPVDMESFENARNSLVVDMETKETGSPPATTVLPPTLKHEATSYGEEDGFADFENMGDFDEFDYEEGDEFQERRWMREQREIELRELGFEGEINDDDFEGIVPDYEGLGAATDQTTNRAFEGPACPICSISLKDVSDQDASVHVNNCLDGNPTPLPPVPKKVEQAQQPIRETTPASKFKRPERAPRPAQENPFKLGSSSGTSSAFSKLMSGHAEDAAWATAAAAEHAARGKPAYERTCPFYKILPGFYTCVDAFRYGAVQGCNAYFLSHFHSDHYVGLTATWRHGPIYCSRPTANLVKQQLRVDPQWVVELEFEKKFEIPNTNGVFVTMIPANHCPGSSIYLFEKTIGKGKTPKVQRVLHCGDFRACPAHVEHPLLRPEVRDLVTGTTAQQKIDVCYLDTTYLNPKYAFPSQEDVIEACADMCVSLNKAKVDRGDGWEQAKQERAGASMANFVRRDSKEDEAGEGAQKDSERGRLLVIVGTYSIGKERICLGIARALDSLIYAPPGKQRICACLEDPELNARLTTDPRAAQVHMTPLFEIRGETLEEYLSAYRDRFSRAVGFRPSGWNYRPPGSRFTESPAVHTVLYSDNWKSSYSVKDLVPQRGSTSRAACFGVPYSEHSSFRELTMFCCALRIDKIIPTVNIGSAKSRERMKLWCERWATERKKNGLFKLPDKDGPSGGKSAWYPRKGTMELRTTL